MKHKSEARKNVTDFIKMVRIQHNSHLMTIRKDNDLAFTMPQFYASKGISHQTSYVELPQQNGRWKGSTNIYLTLLEH